MRYERKYRIEHLTLTTVRRLVQQHPAGFRPLFPDRQVNNIYFDTPDFHAYLANVNGSDRRRKWRLRWYGPEQDRLVDPTFEIKLKDGELGHKLSTPQDTIVWSRLTRLFTQLPQPDLPLFPTLVNNYARAYLATADQRFRITLDYQMRYAPFRPHRPQLHAAPDAAVILELKYAAEDNERARRIFDHLPFRQTKHSKYVTGIDLVMR